MTATNVDRRDLHRRPILTPALSRAVLDRDYLSRSAGIPSLAVDPRCRVIVLQRGRALGVADGGLAFLEPSRLPADAGTWVFLGRTLSASADLAEGAPVLAVLEPGDDLLEESLGGIENAAWIELRRSIAELGERDAGILVEAVALANWHRAAGFSPATGEATTVTESGWVRVDPSTSRENFPRTDPAVIVAVIDDRDRLLLGSNAAWEPGRFSMLAGFVEPGESLEAAVVREIFEEAGVVVADPEYRGSQPWPFPASLMLGFRAHIAPGASSEPKPDGVELRELRWFTREELADAVASGEVKLPGGASISRSLLEDWYGGQIPEPA